MNTIFRKWRSSKKAVRTKHAVVRRAVACFEPLENRQLLSAVVDLRLANGAKSTTASAGQVIPLQIWVTITGKNSSGADDGVQSITGSLLSTKVSSSGSVNGKLASQTVFPFQSQGSQFGTQVDLNGDGNLDVGSNDGSQIEGFFNPRSGGMETSGTVSGNSQSFMLGTASYTVTNISSGGETDLTFRPRVVVGLGFAGVWQEDGQGTNETISSLSGGAAFKINPGTVIQPGNLLTGTVIGTPGSFGNSGNTIAKAFDNNTSTFFDGPTANGNYAGLDLGGSGSVTSLSYTPRSSFGSRMVGGIFQASNSSTFASGNVNLFTVTAAPANGSVTTVSVSASGYRYLRYLSPNGSYGDVAEIKFFGTQPTVVTDPQLTGTLIGTAGSYNNSGNTIAKAVDGNLGTFFDGPTANGNFVGLDLGATGTVSSISFAPRSGSGNRMVGGIFQASNSSTFATGVVNLYTVTAAPANNVLTNVKVSASGYRYLRYLSPNGSYGDIAELKFFGTQTTVTHTKLTGTGIGTAGSYQNNGNTFAKALDGNLSTYFDGATANGNFVGLDLGSAKSITQISFAPRSGSGNRMVGGIFQVSNTANFSSGVVNLYTVTSAPVSGSLTTVSVSAPGTYRYVRYLSPNNSYGNVAEVQFFS